MLTRRSFFGRVAAALSIPLLPAIAAADREAGRQRMIREIERQRIRIRYVSRFDDCDFREHEADRFIIDEHQDCDLTIEGMLEKFKADHVKAGSPTHIAWRDDLELESQFQELREWVRREFSA